MLFLCVIKSINRAMQRTPVLVRIHSKMMEFGFLLRIDTFSIYSESNKIWRILYSHYKIRE